MHVYAYIVKVVVQQFLSWFQQQLGSVFIYVRNPMMNVQTKHFHCLPGRFAFPAWYMCSCEWEIFITIRRLIGKFGPGVSALFGI